MSVSVRSLTTAFAIALNGIPLHTAVALTEVGCETNDAVAPPPADTQKNEIFGWAVPTPGAFVPASAIGPPVFGPEAAGYGAPLLHL